MKKFKIDELIDKGLKGEKTINPGYKNPKVAKAMADQLKFEAMEQQGIIKLKDDETIGRIILNYFGKRDLAKQILEIQPLHYDSGKLWWMWDNNLFYWKIVDETDVLNLVTKLSVANTVSSKEKTEILEALKQTSRLRKPKPIKETWIQFKDEIIDVETRNIIKASPEYFVTNPIPWALHKEKHMLTPTMDKIFEEWVGKDYVKTLYEIMAYCLLPSYPMARIFCFIGEGMNGKSCFLDLLKKFIGVNNVTSSELDRLLSSHFEITRLYKKLVCVMGETNFSEMNKTSILKKLTGRDLIGFEYKNKNPFEDYNYAKILIATNNLPTTTDKTLGFYRRWLIIDFPNRFSEKNDILSTIPNEEYECLALKLTYILKELLEKREFHNEGSIEERTKKYEDRSNPVEKFVREFIVESHGDYITKADFFKKLNRWLKENRFREMADNTIGKKMKELGYEAMRRYFNWLYDGKGGQLQVWNNIKWRNDD